PPAPQSESNLPSAYSNQSWTTEPPHRTESRAPSPAPPLHRFQSCWQHRHSPQSDLRPPPPPESSLRASGWPPCCRTALSSQSRRALAPTPSAARPAERAASHLRKHESCVPAPPHSESPP